MIMITITVVDLLNISIHNTNRFTMNYHRFRLHFILFQEILLVNLHIFHTHSYELNYYSNGQTVYYHHSVYYKTVTIASTTTIITQP